MARYPACPGESISHFQPLFFSTQMLDKKEITMAEFMFFLTGGVGLENTIKNPDPSWISDKCWDELCRMSELHGMEDFRRTFVDQLDQWRKIYENREPYKVSRAREKE